MEVSITIPVYNALPAIRQCLDAAINSTGTRTEIILVDNHPPYADVKDFLSRLRHPRIKCLDPGANLGCEGGVNYGFARSRGKFLVKLDDDIVVPVNNWLSMMRQALVDYPWLGYISLPWPQVKTKQYQCLSRHGYTLEFFQQRIYSGCQMVSQELWKRYFQRDNIPELYASIEEHYYKTSKRMGLGRGYLLSHPVKHLSRSQYTDSLFGIWKIFYACHRTGDDFSTWRQNFRLSPEEYEYLKNTWSYSPDMLEQVRRQSQGMCRP